MAHSTKLSICIATFNRGAFIAQTLDSILSQMQPSVEIIVVDGASPDNTQDVMNIYSTKFPIVRYFRESRNSGVDADYDKAVGYSTGEYCWLMTDDDLLCDGGLSKIIEVIDNDINLVIINAKVKSANLLTDLNSRILPFHEDRTYRAGDEQKFFSEIGTYLSFIGCVIIKRSLWISRDRSSYFGSLFVHVGVIFQNPIIENIYVIADQLISIRWGNAMWSARGFEIWMFKWPTLIWSFSTYSDRRKNSVTPLEPWRFSKNLAFFRAVGVYTQVQYRTYIHSRTLGISRLLPFIIAYVPGKILNTLISIYCLILNRNARARIYDLARSKYSTRVSRSIASLLNIDHL